jgi:hypothetical protein
MPAGPPPRATRSAMVAWALRNRRLRRARSPPRATRSAHGAPRRGAARLCAGGRSRWLPSPPCATRSAPMAWALRARAPTCACACCPPDNCARCLLVVGMSKTSCASRCSKRSVQGALRAPAEGEGGEGWSRDHHARACGGTLLCCRSMCSASRRGATLGSERLLPRPGRSPALSARVLQRFALQLCAHVELRAGASLA